MVPNRTNLAKWSCLVKNHLAPDALAKALAARIERAEADIVILNGVRWEADIDLLDEIGGHLLFISTAPENRYQRVVGRGEKPGEQELTFEQFIAEEQTEADLLMDTLMHRVPKTIDNNGTLDKLEREVKNWLTAISR
jgi:dephospho-CoA kinase